MKIVVLSDPVGERVAEDDLARQRMLAEYDRLKEARDAEIRREFDFHAWKRQELAAERDAAISAEYNRGQSEYGRLAAERVAKIDAEYSQGRSKYESSMSGRNAEIDETHKREMVEYERLSSERNDRIAEETRRRRRRFKRGVDWLPLSAVVLVIAAVVAFLLYEAAAGLESLTALYDGDLGERYAFRYAMSAHQHSAQIALASATGGAALIFAFWALKFRISRRSHSEESRSDGALALPQSAGLPLAASGATLAVLICVNAYIRLTAFVPEYLYGLNYVYFIFSSAAVAMFGVVLAWAGVLMAHWASISAVASANPPPEYPTKHMTAQRLGMRYPPPPQPPSKLEIAKRYPTPPPPPSVEEIAKRYPEPPRPPSMEDIAKRHPEPPRPRGLDDARNRLTWRTRAESERKLDERLAEQLPSDD